MLDSQEIIISIDKRLAEARKEIASLQSALSAMSKPSKAARGSSTRVARTNGAAPAKQTAPTKRAKQTKQTTPTKEPVATKQAAPAKEAKQAKQTTPADNGAAATPAASTNGRSPRTRRAPAKRRTDVVPAGKLVTLLGTGSGMSTAELVKQTGGDRQQLLTLLRELEAAGTVRRSGERRSTLWHIITDEDRIAERVAQLERQSSRNRQAR
jgi:hypothetical protein